MNYLADISEFFKNIDYFGWQYNIKVVFLVLTFIFLFIAVFAYIKAHFIMREHKKHMIHEHAHASVAHETGTAEHAGHEAHAEQPQEDKWAHILEFVNSVREAEWKLAVIEADNYADDALRERGFPGESMGERLMLIKPNDLSTLQDLWDAHKLRNLLVHETNYQLRHEQAIQAVQSFEKVLRELGTIG